MAGLPFRTGLNPVNLNGAACYTAAEKVFQTSVAAPAMFAGDPVAMSPNGVVVLATSAGQDILGVATGFFWVDSTSKQPVESRFKSASVSSANGLYNGVRFKSGAGGPGVKVITDPTQAYAVKATNSVTLTKLGEKIKWQRTGGSTVYGQSNGQVSAGTATSVMFLRVEGVLRAQENTSGAAVDNDWSSPETVIIVTLDDEVRL